jgi:hypothetical protein
MAQTDLISETCRGGRGLFGYRLREQRARKFNLHVKVEP